jgi:hypothetical protein
MLKFDEKHEYIGIDENGFLENEELNYHYNTFNIENLTDSIEVNRYLYSLYEKVDVKSKDMIGVFIVESFAKIHRDYQAVAILSARGLQSQAKAILRTMLEKILVLVSVEKDSKNYNEWLKTQNYRRNILIRAIKRGEIDSHDIDTSKYTEEPDAKNIDSKEWARRADMEWDYNTIYRLFNSNVHHSESGVATDIVFKDGEVEAINIFPDYSETDSVLILSKRYVLIAASVLKKVFNITDDKAVFREYEKFLDDAQEEITKKKETE